MIQRTAFFAEYSDVPEEFGVQPVEENIFEPHYNLSIGDRFPVILTGEKKDENILQKIKWGAEENGMATIDMDSFWNHVKDKKSKPCVVLLSGFYVWKKNRENEHPFFVRMLNSPLMIIAGVVIGDEAFAGIITTDSNPLIHPMSEKMPLIMSSQTAIDWLNRADKQEQFLKTCKDHFLLTEFSVLRVSKKVNDSKNNYPTLIQPIPK